MHDACRPARVCDALVVLPVTWSWSNGSAFAYTPHCNNFTSTKVSVVKLKGSQPSMVDSIQSRGM